VHRSGGVEQSYLNIEAVIAAAEATKREAFIRVTAFSRERDVRARGDARRVDVHWPPAEAMEIMGSKTSARRAAIDAGVPIVPERLRR
jgi:biotin carboxylase